MKHIPLLFVLALPLAGYTHHVSNAKPIETASASTVVSDTVKPDSSLVVAELFTSQGCSSCPPAESLFSQLAEQDNVLTIEWHVDYWDELVHRGSRWKDPYSKREFTRRQRSYNRSLRGENAAYTPQAVVNGHFEGVGNSSPKVIDMINNAPTLSVPVEIVNDKIIVGPSAHEAEILFVTLLDRHVTDVKGGENKGRKLSGRNIALDAAVIGKSGSTAIELTLPKVDEGETCAVIVQTLNGEPGPVLGATKC